MNRKTLAGDLVLGLLLALGSSSAFAAYLFDTGTPNPTNPGDFTEATVRGVQFTVANAVTITSIEHFAAIDAPDDPNNPNDGVADVRMFIRANASSVCTGQFGDFQCPAGAPFDNAADLFGANFSVANTYSNGPGSDPVPQWIGLYGLNWTLLPGTYWVLRTQTRVAPDFATVLFAPFCSSNGGCTNFLGQTYEASNGGSTGWTPNGARTGWRIGIRAVPEPGTLALLGLGLAGLGLSRRRKVD